MALSLLYEKKPRLIGTRGPDLSRHLGPQDLKSLAKSLCPKHTILHSRLPELSGDIRDTGCYSFFKPAYGEGASMPHGSGGMVVNEVPLGILKPILGILFLFSFPKITHLIVSFQNKSQEPKHS